MRVLGSRSEMPARQLCVEISSGLRELTTTLHQARALTDVNTDNYLHGRRRQFLGILPRNRLVMRASMFFIML